ncbi:MAG: hypothetical protein M1826_001162 [Phylliscum demangeonii]|nr:MAG: hypothetical protein M1826_001162 [Phylliscum demangeonii]
MYTPKEMVSLLLVSFLAAHLVHGSPPPEEPKTMFGYPIDEVAHALRTPIVVVTDKLKTLTAFGRQGNIFQPLPPHPQLLRAVGLDEVRRLRYFAYEAEKRWQQTLILRGMMQDNDFLTCMALCLRLPLPVLLQMPSTSNVMGFFFCGAKCQEKTGQDRGIAFPYIGRWLPDLDEGPAWHDLSQEHPPLSIVAKQAQPVFGTRAILRPHPSLHRLDLPYSKSWARLAHSWRSWERAVQEKMPALERKVVAERVGL